MPLKCIGCDTVIPAGATKCPMCLAPAPIQTDQPDIEIKPIPKINLEVEKKPKKIMTNIIALGLWAPMLMALFFERIVRLNPVPKATLLICFVLGVIIIFRMILRQDNYAKQKDSKHYISLYQKTVGAIFVCCTVSFIVLIFIFSKKEDIDPPKPEEVLTAQRAANLREVELAVERYEKAGNVNVKAVTATSGKNFILYHYYEIPGPQTTKYYYDKATLKRINSKLLQVDTYSTVTSPEGESNYSSTLHVNCDAKTYTITDYRSSAGNGGGVTIDGRWHDVTEYDDTQKLALEICPN